MVNAYTNLSLCSERRVDAKHAVVRTRAEKSLRKIAQNLRPLPASTRKFASACEATTMALRDFQGHSVLGLDAEKG